jgi:Z1 domain-containing protein
MSNQPHGVAEILEEHSDTEAWQPVVREETNAVLATLGVTDPVDQENLLEDSVNILRRCVPPQSTPRSLTGIAVGHIQSGKTSSFTAVTALARDNRYAMAIVVGGTTKPLFRQSVRRLEHDLRLHERPDRAWMQIENPGAEAADRLQGPLQDWRDGDQSQTVLLMVMKNHAQLRKLCGLLDALKLDGIPVLVIDDEADQASLNNRTRQGEQSKTYSMLLEVRSRLPVHTFVQYTATPQAPLLINLIDALSPDFARVLRPGQAYTGGKTFFVDRYQELIRIIPASELPLPENNLTEPPETLLVALRLFFVGVATEYARSGGAQPSGNRSMLIHPSMGVLPHEQFGGWVRAIRNLWLQCLKAGEEDAEYRELVEDLRAAYDDLRTTTTDLPEFVDCLRWMAKAIDRTLMTVMNASQVRGTPNLEWGDRYAHILIGGEVLNRGFTVEGLTVTYMPRSKGVGNVDTVQQRARFFGYKSSYIGYCRIFLESEVAAMFRSYVEHEESLRKQLETNGDRPLKEWKRAFLLDPQYSPTRSSVLGLDIYQNDFAAKWLSTDAPHRNESAVEDNLSAVEALRNSVSSWAPDPGHASRTAEQIHLMARVSAIDVLARLLAPFSVVDAADSVRFTGLLLQLRTYLDEHPDEQAVVYGMSSGHIRERGLDDNDKIENMFQGKNPLHGPVVYPGDRNIFDENLLSVQIHMLRIKGSNLHVAALAVRLPKSMSKGVLVATEP